MTAPHPAGSDDALRLHLLVLRCQAGDEGAFARLMEWFGPRTLRYLRGLVESDAEDVQQEVWLAVYQGIAGLGNPRAFRTWLFRTTRHRAIDHLRRRRREYRVLVESEGADAAIPEEEAGFRWSSDGAMEALLQRLGPVQREVLLLRYRDDLSYAEIALVAGCSIGTVRSRLHYARERLRELLEQRRRQEDGGGASTQGEEP
jgi:RNA polymerase sigma-70 factor, ECF subfamily